MNLSNKIQVYTSVLFSVLLLFITIAIYFSFSRLLYNSELEQAQAEARQAVSGINDLQNVVEQKDLLRAYVPADGLIQVVNQDGTSATSVTSGSDQQKLVELEASYYNQEVAEVRWNEETPYAFISVPVIWSDGKVTALQWTESLEMTARNVQILRIVLISVVVLAMIPLIISARLLSNLITKPVLRLIHTMDQIRGSGEFKRIPAASKTKDELSIMAETFNEMMSQLESNYEKQERFVSDASHELKTPLTVIESYASLLKRRGLQDEDIFKEAVEAIHSETQRMREMTQQLLLLARQEEQWKVEQVIQPLTPLLKTTVASFEKAYQREVELLVDGEYQVLTDPDKVKQLLYIFMDNARKYSTTSIVVRVGKQGDYATVSIIDKGIGISEQNLAKVFDRFYQVDPSRNRKTGGYGLGLSLAQDLSQTLGTKITIDSKLEKGTTATIFLPLSQ